MNTTPRLSPQWRLGLAGVAGIGVTFGFARYGYGLFLPEFRREFDLSVTQVGLIGSAGYLGFLAALLLVGGLVARFGPRPLVVTGGLSATVGMALVCFARDPATLITGLVLAGTSPGWAWAPYSDAVDRMVPAGLRAQVMGAVATGTAFAVAVAGPLALLARDTGWRFVWLVFAVLSLLTTIGNARVLPSGPHRRAAAGQPERTGLRAFTTRRALPLFWTAVLYGLVGAVYWAFAVEAVSDAAGEHSVTVPLFWTVMGLSGTAGVLTGHALTRYGLRAVHTGLFAGITAAVALLGTAPGTLPAVLASGLLYGPCFMAGSGLLAVWSYRVFPAQPSTGFSVTVFFVGLGTVAGPAALGAAAEAYGLRAALLVTAALGGVSLAMRPARTARTARRPPPLPQHRQHARPARPHREEPHPCTPGS